MAILISDEGFYSFLEESPGLRPADILADFNATQGDKIDVHAIDANELLAGNQDFVFIGGADYTAPGQIRVVSTGVDTYIALSTDADIENEAVFFISGMVTPDASWFVL